MKGNVIQHVDNSQYNKNTPKQFWNGVNSLIGRDKPRNVDSVVILAKKSAQNANKGCMMYYGRYSSQLTFPKSPKQSSSSNSRN